jgi:hypothetical protein
MQHHLLTLLHLITSPLSSTPVSINVRVHTSYGYHSLHQIPTNFKTRVKFQSPFLTNYHTHFLQANNPSEQKKNNNKNWYLIRTKCSANHSDPMPHPFWTRDVSKCRLNSHCNRCKRYSRLQYTWYIIFRPILQSEQYDTTTHCSSCAQPCPNIAYRNRILHLFHY